jgi:DNA-binding SARP family transcriptional activator
MIILHTLGTAAIEIEGSTSIAPNAPKRLALLLYLAVERGREFSSEQLANLVFPEKASSEARHCLRETLYQLRRAGVPVVVHGRRGYSIEAKDVRSDYEAALGATTIDDDTMRRMTGGFLPTVAPPACEAYVDWLDALRGVQVAALVRRVVPQMENAMRGARWDSAELAARACIGLDPWNERATFALAEILAVGGSKAAALQILGGYMAEFGPRSELANRAGALRRRIAEGLTTAIADGGDRDGAASAALAGAPPRLVGRETELAALLRAFERARSGDSQCIVVSGEAGIGKTRLVADFSTAAVIRKAHLKRVVIQPHDGDRPMGAFVDLVPALLQAPGALGCSPESMAALGNLTGKRTGDDAPPHAAAAEEHEQRWSAVSRAVVDLCEAIANERTLVLVIEDAHWLDPLSANTIGRIVGTRRQARIMVIATTRDPRALVREIRLTERCQTLTLLPLGPEAANELLDIVLPATPATTRTDRVGESLPSIKTRIAGISAGNPLFLISLAAHSRAHRGPFEIPGTIVETFAQRIDALSHRAMSVLATCAALGKHSTMRRLVRSLEMRKHELVESLLELTGSGLVLGDEESAVPAHPLVPEALRSRLPQPARRAVAHAVAATLEADANDGGSPGLWWDAAESWRVADNPERAINALRQCASHALEIGRPGEAARILNEAAALPQSPVSLSEVTEALIRAADSANDFWLILQGAKRRRRARRSDSHDDLELAELRAAIRSDQSADAVERLFRCASNPAASASHRVDAGIVLLKTADALGSEIVRSRAMAAVSSDDLAVVQPLSKLEFRLLVAVTADWSSAIDTARSMLRECVAHPKAPNCRYAQNAAIALLYGGRWIEAIDAFKTSYAMAYEMGSASAQLAASVMLAGFFFEIGQNQEFNDWMGKCNLLVQEAPHLASDFDLVLTRTLVALHGGEAAVAEAAAVEAESFGLFSTGLRARWKRVIHLGIRSLRGTLLDSDEALARLIVAERLFTLNGVRDLEIGVACQVLAARGQKKDATEVLQEFLATERRQLGPLSPSLLRALEATRLRASPTSHAEGRVQLGAGATVNP